MIAHAVVYFCVLIVQIVAQMICVGQQLWEIQEGRFGSPVPSDVISMLASELRISTDLLEFEKIVQQHNVSYCTHVMMYTTHAWFLSHCR